MYKKIILVLISILILSLVAGCGSTSSSSANNTTIQENKTKSTVGLKDSVVQLVTDNLKKDELVKDVSIIKSDDGKIIVAAVQVNAATNETKAKDLVDTVIRQLGGFSGGKQPTKTYLGELWENYDAHVIIFKGEKDKIVDSYLNKGSNKIRY